MSFVLETHQQNVANAVHQYHAEISEIEGHLRLRAMANDVSDRELELLRRLKSKRQRYFTATRTCVKLSESSLETIPSPQSDTSHVTTFTPVYRRSGF
jgi:hypothetical protein